MLSAEVRTILPINHVEHLGTVLQICGESRPIYLDVGDDFYDVAHKAPGVSHTFS